MACLVSANGFRDYFFWFFPPKKRGFFPFPGGFFFCGAGCRPPARSKRSFRKLARQFHPDVNPV